MKIHNLFWCCLLVLVLLFLFANKFIYVNTIETMRGGGGGGGRGFGGARGFGIGGRGFGGINRGFGGINRGLGVRNNVVAQYPSGTNGYFFPFFNVFRPFWSA